MVIKDLTVKDLIERLSEIHNQDAVVEFHNGLFDIPARIWEFDDSEYNKLKLELGA